MRVPFEEKSILRTNSRRDDYEPDAHHCTRKNQKKWI
jgi:hypothetical protein